MGKTNFSDGAAHFFPSRPMTMLQEPDILLDPPELPDIPLPKGWSQYTLLAVQHVSAHFRCVIVGR